MLRLLTFWIIKTITSKEVLYYHGLAKIKTLYSVHGAKYETRKDNKDLDFWKYDSWLFNKFQQLQFCVLKNIKLFLQIVLFNKLQPIQTLARPLLKFWHAQLQFAIWDCLGKIGWPGMLVYRLSSLKISCWFHILILSGSHTNQYFQAQL